MAKRILIVDDEAPVRLMLRRFLENKGYSVLEATGGHEALEVYNQDKPDAVFLDVRMPGKDGMETLLELKALDPKASVIMVTAVHEEETGMKALEQGAFDYITKPIDTDYLELSLMTKLEMLGDDE